MFLPIAAVLALQVWLSMTDRFDSEVARAAAVVPSFLVLCILGGDETVTEQPQLGAAEPQGSWPRVCTPVVWHPSLEPLYKCGRTYLCRRRATSSKLGGLTWGSSLRLSAAYLSVVYGASSHISQHSRSAVCMVTTTSK